MNKKFNALVGLSLTLISSTSMASYVGFGAPQDFTFFTTPTAWSPGVNTARVAGPVSAPTPSPGGATWSIMGAGIANGSVDDPDHGSNLTTDITGLLPGSDLATIANIFNSALDTWATDSGFSNLGQVADGGVAFGAPEASDGALGDLRFGSIFIDGGSGSNVLAHAFQPGNEAIGGPGRSVLGDLHFDNGNTWVDNASASAFEIDLYTVALHEIGHAIGLGHSSVIGSVMEATYAGARRSLGADDIAGIQALYGPNLTAVPVPAPIVLFLSGLTALRLYSKKNTNN